MSATECCCLPSRSTWLIGPAHIASTVMRNLDGQIPKSRCRILSLWDIVQNSIGTTRKPRGRSHSKKCYHHSCGIRPKHILIRDQIHVSIWGGIGPILGGNRYHAQQYRYVGPQNTNTRARCTGDVYQLVPSEHRHACEIVEGACHLFFDLECSTRANILKGSRTLCKRLCRFLRSEGDPKSRRSHPTRAPLATSRNLGHSDWHLESFRFLKEDPIFA